MTSTPTLPPDLDPRGRAGDRPRLPQPVREARTGRAFRVVAILTALLTLAVSGLLWVVYARVDGNIDRLGGVTSGGQDESMSIVLVGADSREGEGNEAFQDPALQVSGSRSDTTILATFPADGGSASLVSFPRDAWVTIPAHTARDGSKVAAREARINTAFQDGGPALLVDTLEELVDVEIDHYVEIDFAGFQRMVDVLGGVTVCLTEPAQDEMTGIDLPAGESRLDGAQALAFVRQRQNLDGGDLSRIERQQQVLASVMREALAAGTLLDLPKLTGLLDSVTQSVRVDDGLTLDGMKNLALGFRELTAGQVSFATAPVLEQRRIDEKAVLILDDDRLQAMFHPGETVEQPAPESEQATGDVAVRVLNGAGIQGLARRASDDLARLGFAIGGAPGNADTSAAVTTTVVHPPDLADSAVTVQRAIPGSVLEPDPAADGITVIVGAAYEDAPAVAPQSGGTSTPPGSSTTADVPATAATELTCTA